MKTIISVIAILASFSLYAGEYTDVRNLTLDANDLKSFKADVSSGYFRVTGSDEIDQILVKATVRVETSWTFDNDDAEEYVKDKLILKLEEQGSLGKLEVNFGSSLLSFSNRNHSVDLDITLPSNLFLDIQDSSGSILVNSMKHGVLIDDSSGSVGLSNIIGNVDIKDGSGSLKIKKITGNLTIDDGSGSITINNVEGDINIEDGSGSIVVNDVIGSVNVDDGSGSINVNRVSKDFVLVDDGSGRVSIAGIEGKVKGYGKHKSNRKNRYKLQ